ncbi:MAG: hypothetical protein WDW36_001497 [Sanguina aurantia]
MSKSLDLLGKDLDQDDLDLDENAPGYKGGEERDSQFRDVVAFNKAVERRARVSFSMAFAGVGTVSFLLCAYVLCTTVVSDPVRAREHHAQADPHSYILPMVSFGTAFMLNFMTLMFERESAKFQLALLACYINFLAGFCDYLCWKGYAPVTVDAWGQGFQLLRTVMWLHTTPAMVYLLSIISDFSQKQVFHAVIADVAMLSLGILGHLVTSLTLSVCLFAVAFCLFFHVIPNLWRMFDAALGEVRNDASRLSLESLRLFTVGLWLLFPMTFFLVKLGLVSVATEEWLWCVGDFLGKVMFSSSLLHGNFLTIEQRRLISMRIVEQGNRIQVINELKVLVEQKESFMSSMSHELRTPLNGIIGLSDVLLAGTCGEPSESMTKTINTIKTSGSRLLNLINDILDAASIHQGKLTIKHEKINLRRIVDDVVDLCQPLAKRNVRLVNDVPSSIPCVLADSGRIMQVFYNLIGNSCKFTHSGYISVAACVKGGKVEVAVSDSGIGIPEDKFGQIFMAFEQVDMSITRKYGGTGLGLSLVKQLVEAHGGSITLTSKEGAGTTFFITLNPWDENDKEIRDTKEILPGPVAGAAAPVIAPAPLPVSAPQAASPRSLRNPSFHVPAPVKQRAQNLSRSRLELAAPPRQEMVARFAQAGQREKPRKRRVLSVDDDPINQMVVQNLLAPAGYEVIQAMDGAEALQILAESATQPDMILLDVMMPGMSGFEVCRKLRELYPLHCIPVIMISAKSQEEHIVEGLVAGSNDYMVKPFGRQEILARIAAHLNFRSAVFSAGEMSGLAHGGDVAELLSLMNVQGLDCSLGKAQQAAMDPTSPLQPFEKLTLTVVRLANLAELSAQVPNPTLLRCLATLYTRLDTLLTQHQCYCMEGQEQRLVIVSVNKATIDAHNAGDMERVIALAVHDDGESELAGVLLGSAQQATGRLDDAVATFERLARRWPTVSAHWNNLGVASRQRGDADAAERAFLAAQTLAPADAEAAYACHVCGDSLGEEAMLAGAAGWPPQASAQALTLAAMLATQGDFGRSRWGFFDDALARAKKQLDASPATPESPSLKMRLLARRIALYERSNQVDRAQRELARLPLAALDDLPPDALHARAEVWSVHASLALRDKAPDRAAALFRQMRELGVDHENDAAANFGLASASDKQGQYEVAWLAAQAAHAAQLAIERDVVPELLAADSQPLEMTGRSVSPAAYATWRTLAAPTRALSPVFVVGFPRSGTTLLEQMIDAHPDFQSMDERAFIHELTERMDADIVDSLETELASARTTTSQVSQAVAQSSVLQAMVEELQRQLGASMLGQKTAEATCQVAEKRLERFRSSSIEGDEPRMEQRRYHSLHTSSSQASLTDMLPSKPPGAGPSSRSMPPPSLTATDMPGILEELGFPQLIPRFEAEGVTSELLPFLGDEVLRELGAETVGVRMKLKLAGQALAAPDSPQ